MDVILIWVLVLHLETEWDFPSHNCQDDVDHEVTHTLFGSFPLLLLFEIRRTSKVQNIGLKYCFIYKISHGKSLFMAHHSKKGIDTERF